MVSQLKFINGDEDYNICQVHTDILHIKGKTAIKFYENNAEKL